MIVNIGEQKLKVYWKHYNLSQTDWNVNNGGTKCNIVDINNEIFAEGRSLCVKKDNFNKSKGRIVSLTKAIKHLPKDVRKLFWESYGKEIGY